MKKIVVFCLFAAALAMAQAQKQRVAVLPTLIDQESKLAEKQLEMLTDKVRSIASDSLPLSDFILLKQDFVVEQLGAEAFFNDCKEGTCIGTLVDKVQADFGARCDIFVSDNKLWLKFELYGTLRGESEAGTISAFTEEVIDVPSMLALIERRVPNAFKRILISQASVPVAPQSPQPQQQPLTTKEKDAVTDAPKMRFGARVNFGALINSIKGTRTETRTGWSGYSENIEEKYDVTLIGGGVGLGVYVLIPVRGIYIVPEIAIQNKEGNVSFNSSEYRGGSSNLREIEDETYKETAIYIPIFFRFRYREENIVYLGIGPYICVVLNTDGDIEEFLEISRVKSNFGAALELGFRINRHFSLDIRGLGVIDSFDNAKSSSMLQYQLGFAYTF
ncbi:MAG: PorT family protein [Fibromonadales bacterium]|nr:PorT family protein [Fibromonadales bacterium]